MTAADVVAKHQAKAAKEKEEQKWFDLKQNTSVYITGLPTDVTEAEMAEVGFLRNPVGSRSGYCDVWPDMCCKGCSR